MQQKGQSAAHGDHEADFERLRSDPKNDRECYLLFATVSRRRTAATLPGHRPSNGPGYRIGKITPYYLSVTRTTKGWSHNAHSHLCDNGASPNHSDRPSP